MTWRERSSAWMPLAWPSAVPTAPLLNEPMIRCSPLWRIQLPDQSVLSPVSKTNTASRAARSLTARAIGLLVQHLVPRPALGCDTIEEVSACLRRHPIEQRSDRRAHRAYGAEFGRRAATEYVRPIVDLDDGALARQEYGIRIVGAEHQKQIAIHDGAVDRLCSDHADAAHPARIVVRHDVLALDGMDQRRLEPIGERAQFLGRAMTSGAADDHDASGFV